MSSSGLSSSFASAATSLKSSFSGVTRKLFRSASPPASPALTSITTTPPRSATRKALPAPQVAYSTRALPAPQVAYSTRVAAPSLSIMPMLRSMLLKVWDNLGSNNALGINAVAFSINVF